MFEKNYIVWKLNGDVDTVGVTVVFEKNYIVWKQGLFKKRSTFAVGV